MSLVRSVGAEQSLIEMKTSQSMSLLSQLEIHLIKPSVKQSIIGKQLVISIVYTTPLSTTWCRWDLAPAATTNTLLRGGDPVFVIQIPLVLISTAITLGAIRYKEEMQQKQH